MKTHLKLLYTAPFTPSPPSTSPRGLPPVQGKTPKGKGQAQGQGLGQGRGQGRVGVTVVKEGEGEGRGMPPLDSLKKWC